MNKKIIYLSGAIPKEGRNRQAIEGDPKLGFLITPNMGNKAPRPQHWGADSGLFSTKGAREFNQAKYLTWLSTRDRSNCLFAPAPDVYADWDATLKASRPVLPEIRRRGFKAALILQDGATPETVPWGEFDVLFIGGTTEFKLSTEAARIARQAHDRGVWVHMGRVNSYKRLAYAASIECDSADGTFLKYGPDQNIPRMQGWFEKLAGYQEAA